MPSDQRAAFVIGQIAIRDAAKWAAYRDAVPATLLPWGAQLLVRGKRFAVLSAVLSGAHAHTDTVVIRFPDRAAVEGWHASPAYQALIPLRQEAADVVLVGYEE